MPSRTPDGSTVAIILATAVAIGWVVAVVVAALNPADLTFRGSVVLYGVGGSLIGAVVGWLARTGRGGDDE